ncbi:MAG TPA: Ig-like domain-containing protein [Candidatus Acidoferrales bacterium]|nr:Ig-like domain-containing protein [Candidatus Acidoferrales bacterium]
MSVSGLPAYAASEQAPGSASVRFAPPANATTADFPIQVSASLLGQSATLNCVEHVSGLPGISLRVLPATASYGGTTTLAAGLTSGGAGVPGGSVSFKLFGSAAGSATSDSGGGAQLAGVSVAGQDAGTYPDAVTASYTGPDGAVVTAQGSLTIGSAATSLDLGGVLGTFAESTTLTATLRSGGQPLSSRNVSFSLNGAAVGSAKTDGDGVARLSGASLAGIAVGAYAGGVRAGFAGERDYGSTSGSATLTVTAGPPAALVLSPVAATITAGGGQAYTARAVDAHGRNLGDVTGSAVFSIAPDGQCAAAVCTAMTAGAHTVSARLGSVKATVTLNVNAAALASLLLNPSTARITAGGSQGYSASGFDAYGNSLGDVTSTTTFAIAPDGSCTGSTCTATAAGAHTVTGSSAGRSATASLRVDPGPLATLSLSPATASISAGGSQAYAAQGADRYGNSLGDLTSATTFSISPDGSCTGSTCTAGQAGAHTVTGTSGGRTGTATLNVRAGPLAALRLSPSAVSITAGSWQAFTAQGLDANGNSLGDVTSVTVFSIAPSGGCAGAACTATAVGVYTVTGVSGSATATATLVVNPGSLDQLGLSPASATIVAGDSQAYQATGYDAFGNSLGDVTSATSFSVAPDGTCSGAACTATVAGAHVVTGRDGGRTGTASLTVNAGPVDHLLLSPASTTIVAGSSQAYTATGYDAFNNSLGDITASTSFAIAPNGSCTAGACRATQAGPHTVTGTTGGASAGASLNVIAGPLASLTLAPGTASITAGGSQAYTAQGFDRYGNSLGDLTSSTTFSIGPDGSCTGATCTATVAGAHTLTGTNLGKTATGGLTVNPGPLATLTLSPSPASISAGGSQSYTATGYDGFGNSLGDLTTAATFSIAPNGSCAGATCTATTAGAHTVTGTRSGVSGTASLTVNAGPPATLTLSPGSASISAGGAQAYTATGADLYGNGLGDLTSATVFSISPDGSCAAATCTATAAGAHTVTGTSAGRIATASLAVNPAALVTLSLSPASATITAGGSQAYTAQGFDQYGNSLGDLTAATGFSITPDGSCASAACTATVAGVHTVTGSRSGVSGTASLKVKAGPLASLALSPASAAITAGASQGYTAQGLDQYGNSLGDVTAATAFSIAPDGSCSLATCTATAAGAHTVTGSDGGRSGTASLNVTPGSLASITLSPASASVAFGGGQAYTATAFDQYGNSRGDLTSSTSFSISPNGSCSAATCVPGAVGAHTVTGSASGKTSTASLSVNPAPTTTSAGAPSVQYSDPVTLSARVSPASLNGSALTGSVQFAVAGSNLGAPVAIDASGNATLSYTVSQGPNSYALSATFTSTNPNFAGSSGSGTLAVTPEDASLTYIGDFLVSACGAGCPVHLSTTVVDSADASRGNIGNASVQFVDRATNATLCGPVAVTLVNPSDPTTGTAACTWTAPALDATYTVGTVVGGFYKRNDPLDDVIITVSVSQGVHGSGAIEETSVAPAGLCPAAGLESFGFTAHNPPSPQDNLKLAVRTDPSLTCTPGGTTGSKRSYQVAGGSIYYFNKSASNRVTFRANQATITDKAAKNTFVTGATVQVSATDNGSSGDTIAITICVSSAAGLPANGQQPISCPIPGVGGVLWFSNDWNGSQTLEQVLLHGQITVS